MNHLEISEILLAWYRKTDRPLPWRKTYNPYHIWISEIMLQQTQMERGVAYFNAWVAELPDVFAVARADEEKILRLWQGLGYYARARNIQKAAAVIVSEYNGVVPDDYNELLKLPGIGPYTASAIASIAGNQGVAVIDANVMRVYSRLFDIYHSVTSALGKNEIENLAKQILPPGKARHYNQAIMDFGGLLCKSKSPDCASCPLSHLCLAFQKGVVEKRPVLPEKKGRLIEKKLIGLIVSEKGILVYKRSKEKLWSGLWDFPGVLLYSQKEDEFISPRKLVAKECEELICNQLGRKIIVESFFTTVSHQFTNHKRDVECWLCRTSDTTLHDGEKWVSRDELEELAFPAGARKIVEYLRRNKNLQLSW